MTTLNEIAQLLGFDDKKQSDFHVWGKVVSMSGDKATVSLNASQVNVECTKCVPCNVNDRVLVLIMRNGQALIMGNKTTRKGWNDFYKSDNGFSSIGITYDGRRMETGFSIGESLSKPFIKVATTGKQVTNWYDGVAYLLVAQPYAGGNFGILKVCLRTNNQDGTSGFASGELKWLCNYGFPDDAFTLKVRSAKKNCLADLWYKATVAYGCLNVYVLGQGYRFGAAPRFILQEPVGTSGSAWCSSIPDDGYTSTYSPDYFYEYYGTRIGNPKQLWSGTLSKGGSVTIPTLGRYSSLGVMLKGCSGLYIGTVSPDSYICCSGTMDQGSSVEIRSARFRKTSSTTLMLDFASKLVGTTRTEMQVSSIYGLL